MKHHPQLQPQPQPQPPHYNHHRPKFAPPIFWERPYFPSWDPSVHYVNYHTQDDNYFNDYYNRQSHSNDCCRYDSDGNLNAGKAKNMPPPSAAAAAAATSPNCGVYCPNRYYSKPPPLHPCYSCERSSSSQALTANAAKFNNNNNKVQILSTSNLDARHSTLISLCALI